eukprot:839372-Lingulodinium_polyedra.AAC.1
MRAQSRRGRRRNPHTRTHTGHRCNQQGLNEVQKLPFCARHLSKPRDLRQQETGTAIHLTRAAPQTNMKSIWVYTCTNAYI